MTLVEVEGHVILRAPLLNILVLVVELFHRGIKTSSHPQTETLWASGMLLMMIHKRMCPSSDSWGTPEVSRSPMMQLHLDELSGFCYASNPFTLFEFS